MSIPTTKSANVAARSDENLRIEVSSDRECDWTCIDPHCKSCKYVSAPPRLRPSIRSREVHNKPRVDEILPSRQSSDDRSTGFGFPTGENVHEPVTHPKPVFRFRSLPVLKVPNDSKINLQAMKLCAIDSTEEFRAKIATRLAMVEKCIETIISKPSSSLRKLNYQERKDLVSLYRLPRQDEGDSGIWNVNRLWHSTERRRCRWVFTRIAALIQPIVSRFVYFRGSLLSTTISVFSASMKGVSGQEMEIGRVGVPNVGFNERDRSLLELLAWWILWAIVVLLMSIVGPKLRFRNEAGTSFILAFIFAISKSAVEPTDGPNFWAIISSAISFGSSIWLGLATMSRDSSVFVHIIRYFGLAGLLYNILCNSKLGDQNRRQDLSVTLPELSALGSVLINALYNEKMKQLVELMESCWNAILAMLRLQRVPVDDIERSPQRSDR